MLHVICFGNYWQGDDGFGIHVFRRLCGMDPLPGVDLFEAGTAGLSALGHFEGCRKAVIVDSVKSGGPIGHVRLSRWEDVDPPTPELSVHAIGVNHLMATLPVVFEGGPMPDVVVVGAEIGAIRPFTDELSPRVEAAVEVAAGLVRGECESWARGLRDVRGNDNMGNDGGNDGDGLPPHPLRNSNHCSRFSFAGRSTSVEGWASRTRLRSAS